MDKWYNEQVEKLKQIYHTNRVNTLIGCTVGTLIMGIAIYALQVYLKNDNALKVTAISVVVILPLALLMGYLTTGFAGMPIKFLKRRLEEMDDGERVLFLNEVQHQVLHKVEFKKGQRIFQYMPSFFMQTMPEYHIINMKGITKMKKIYFKGNNIELFDDNNTKRANIICRNIKEQNEVWESLARIYKLGEKK